ncbi:antirestriction protein ArdA [Corynebacterium sp. CCM 8863]|uniref:Antirestriction protein ArdA n=1 Tax=Corynebacterium meridianum TaxID=2765363 RepID=A0A934HXL4_9CORY|nr:antirestriction protein ArdA [Corynebacterium meridianum]MBI8988437.1 antirestriction protein ArdA [Corynebacterium meridianum]
MAVPTLFASTATTSTRPRVWVGCLHCYNSGRLVGAWYECADIADDPSAFDVGRIHDDGGYPATTSCEELWCFDTDNVPSICEFDLLEATRWGECYAELDAEHLWSALCAWVASGSYTQDAYGLPVVSDFLERFCGHWDSFNDFAYALIEDTIDMSSWDDLAQRYFDYEAFARDLKYDYSTQLVEPYCGQHGVFIFRDS